MHAHNDAKHNRTHLLDVAIVLGRGALLLLLALAQRNGAGGLLLALAALLLLARRGRRGRLLAGGGGRRRRHRQLHAGRARGALCGVSLAHNTKITNTHT